MMVNAVSDWRTQHATVIGGEQKGEQRRTKENKHVAESVHKQPSPLPVQSTVSHCLAVACWNLAVLVRYGRCG